MVAAAAEVYCTNVFVGSQQNSYIYSLPVAMLLATQENTNTADRFQMAVPAPTHHQSSSSSC